MKGRRSQPERVAKDQILDNPSDKINNNHNEL